MFGFLKTIVASNANPIGVFFDCDIGLPTVDAVGHYIPKGAVIARDGRLQLRLESGVISQGTNIRRPRIVITVLRKAIEMAES